MNKKNTEYLYKKYPTLFGDHDKPMNQTAMCWGFDTGDGWLKLVDDLSYKIQERCTQEGYTDVVATQVKEKYGSLRFYINHGVDFIYELIDAAEAKSMSICELCGNPGELYTDGWYITRCDECIEK